MTFPVFPTLYAYSINKKPTFKTLVQTPRSGRETTRLQRILPLWEFELRAEVLRDETQNQVPAAYFDGYTDLQQVAGLFAACGGQFGWFYFDDTSDNSRSEQGIGTGDGSTVAFRLTRTVTYGPLTFTEPVGGINLGESITVFVNGSAVPQLGNWSISSDLLYLVFNSPPANGAVVQISFSYYYLCHFISDDIDFEQFMWNRWSAKSIRFRSTNPSEIGAPLETDPLVPPPIPTPPVPPTIPPTIPDSSSGSISTPSNHIILNISGGLDIQTGDIIVLYIAEASGLGTVTSISTGLPAFTKIIDETYGPQLGLYAHLEVWTTTATAPLTGEVITVNLSATISSGVASATVLRGCNGLFDPGLTQPFISNSATASITLTYAAEAVFFWWVALGTSSSPSAAAPLSLGFTSKPSSGSGRTTVSSWLTIAGSPITSVTFPRTHSGDTSRSIVILAFQGT